MYCKKCGKDIQPGSAFCPNCGEKVVTEQASISPRPTEQPQEKRKNKSVYCKNCGQEIDAKAAICVHCGVPTKKKKSIFKRWWFWVIVALLVLIFLGSGDTVTYEHPNISESEYRASCMAVTYDEWARNPDNYAGQLITVTGEVIQVIENGNDVELRINITSAGNEYYAYYEDTVYAEITLPEGSDKILEGDVLTLYGIATGTHTYSSILGETITIPSMNIMYADFLE